MGSLLHLMGEDLFKIEDDEGTHIGIGPRLVLVDVSEGKVDLLVGEIVNYNLQVAGVETGNDSAHSQLGIDLAVMLIQ